jgi:CO/xanthine dehydrogenase FAD-binding subunit
MRRQPWSDIIPLFRALGANATLFDGGSRPLRLDDLYAGTGHPADAILTEVVLPAQPASTAAAFRKYARSAVDIATLNCAARVQVDNGRCADIRLLVGATPRPAERVPTAEDCLVAQELTDDTIAVAAAEAAAMVDTGDDLRASATYRTHLVAVGITRCLEEIRHRLREELI